MVKYKFPEARRPDIDRHVARRMRERRVVLGLSQLQLAERIGFSFQQIHKYENGINRIAAGVLERIARVLGVGLEFFYQGLGEARAQSNRPRALLSLAQDFTRLETAQQHAILALSRALAGMNTEDETDLDTPT